MINISSIVTVAGDGDVTTVYDAADADNAWMLEAASFLSTSPTSVAGTFFPPPPLLKPAPSLLSLTTRSGWTPLHAAVAHPAPPLDLIKYLIRKYPAALHVAATGIFGRTLTPLAILTNMSMAGHNVSCARDLLLSCIAAETPHALHRLTMSEAAWERERLRFAVLLSLYKLRQFPGGTTGSTEPLLELYLKCSDVFIPILSFL